MSFVIMYLERYLSQLFLIGVIDTYMTLRSPHSIDFEHFIGIDPSWTGKNKSAVVILKRSAKPRQDGKLLVYDFLYSSDINKIIDFIYPLRGTAIIGIDAPLIIRNVSGHRKHELEFLSYYPIHVPLYPVNLSHYKVFFPVELYKLLNEIGVSFDNGNIYEVYPHATLAAKFFGRLFSYKRGNNDKRLAKLSLIRQKLMEYVEVPSVHFKYVKEFEDYIDSVICALTVYLATTEDVMIFGSPSEGMLLAPYPKSFNAR
ncbi:DUF429 domain-containing protein [Fervidobacterium sp.]